MLRNPFGKCRRVGGHHSRPLSVELGDDSSIRTARPGSVFGGDLVYSTPVARATGDLEDSRRRRSWCGPILLGRPGFVARIIGSIEIFETKRADGRYLCNVFARLRPVEVPGFSRQHNNAAWWIGLHLIPSNIWPSPM